MHTLITQLKGTWLAPSGHQGPLSGLQMNQVNLLENSYLWIENDKLAGLGPMANMETEVPESIRQQARILECPGQYAFPLFVDAHSHLVFAAWRENEMEMRLEGKTYLDIAAAGGGILNSALRLQNTPEEVLFEAAWDRLQALIRMGTGALEIKSGYGLTTEAELKMLRVIRQLREKAPIPIKATFLGAHAIPKSHTSRETYLQLIEEEMLPLVARENLADYCDVFCDTGFFTPEETIRILRKAGEFGLKAKVHANELAKSGGVQAGVACQAVSADHLECMGDEELSLLQQSKTIPVLLPGTAFFLGIHPPDARAMLNWNLPVALSSDYNPGTCPSGNMEFVISLASLLLKMRPAEAIHAATLNSACAMEVQDEAGQILPGRSASFFLTKPISSPAFLPYHFGETSLAEVWVNGKVFS